jgi:Dyp-type peroxidase family
VAFAKGVLPDRVIRDPRAEGLLILATLRPDLDVNGVRGWLEAITDAVKELREPLVGDPVARVAVGFGPSFFATSDGAPRFELVDREPLGLRTPPAVTASEALPNTDVFFYVMTTSEAVAVRFLERLSATRNLGLAAVNVARGFQRADGREMFGFLDGLRNPPWRDRYRVVFVDRERVADEPHWTEDGTYLAYLEIEQDLDRWEQVSLEEQEQMMGRRKADGSRLDLAPGSSPRGEGDFVGDPPGSSAHVRKAGPRGAGHDGVAIFRRGVPFLELNVDGSRRAGLHFVSFQYSLDVFNTIFNVWMLNDNFPVAGAGRDRLFAADPPLVRVRRAGFFFVAPHDERFIGAGMFDEPPADPVPRRVGRLFVRKRAFDANGLPVLVELSGIKFQVVREDDRSAAGEPFVTDSAGHALSPDLPVRTRLVLQEVEAPPNLEPSPDLPFVLERRRQVVEVANHVRQVGPYGG